MRLCWEPYSIEPDIKSLYDQELRRLQEIQTQNTAAAESGLNESSLIDETNSQIMTFIDELSGYDRLESEISRRVGQLLRDQNSTAQVLKDQLSEAIHSQEVLIRQTQEELATSGETRREELRSVLELQQQQLLELRQLVYQQQVKEVSDLLLEKNEEINLLR